MGTHCTTSHPKLVLIPIVLPRWYYLFFSSNVYSSTLYDISYAVSQSVTGPYTKAQAPNAPFLVTGDSGLTAPGGATVINALSQSLPHTFALPMRLRSSLQDQYVNMAFHADLNGKDISGGRGMYTAGSICLSNGVAKVSC